MSPWLSVILPVHAGERFLGATLASAAAEHPEGVEFIVYDSGEDAGACRRVTESFADRLAIRWCAAPDQKPWTAKTNRGVAEARAPHVATLHQDDLWLPGHLAAISSTLADFPDAVMSIASSRFVGPDGEPLGLWRLPFSPGAWPAQEFATILLVQNSIAIPSPVIRRDAYLACGGMNDDLWYTADWDLYLKLSALGTVAVRSQATTAFRVHSHSLTMTGSRDITAFRRQQEVVYEEHVTKLSRQSRSIERQAKASIAINCALASAAAGGRGVIPAALFALLKLGPANAWRYIAHSRILDRLKPRLRLKLSGGL